jgi:integrase
LNVFKEWVPPYAPVASLDETLWDKYYTYLASQCEKGTLSHSTAGSTLNAAREFIRSRHKKRVIEEPRNLGDYAISPRLKTIEVFTIDEVKTLLAHCHTDRDTLFILLSLNCGMYGVDMAKLTKEQYQNGHIIRKRSKTENRSVNVPCVDYPLWDLTDTILRKEMSEHPTLVLVNNNGEPLWTEQEKEGKFVRNNNVKCAISRIKDRAGITKPTKCLRKTSASLLGGHAEYGRYAEYFLGESPTSMADRHYVKPNDEQFGRAIHWLGQQYGMGCQWISIARRGNRCQ